MMLYPRYDDLSSLKLITDQPAAIEKTKLLAQKLKIDVTDKDPSVSLHRNDDLLENYQKLHGLKETTIKINQDLPGYYWRITYSDIKEKSDSVKVEPTADGNKKSLRFEVSTNGQVVSIDSEIEMSQLPNEFRGTPLENAQYFLHQFTQYDSLLWKYKSQEFELSKGDSIYRFSWITSSVNWTDTLLANIEIKGESLSKLNVEPVLPKKQDNGFNIEGLSDILSAIVTIVMIIFVIVILIRRLRQDKIDFKMNWVIAIITTVMMAMRMYPDMMDSKWWEILLSVGILSTFVGLGAFILTGVAESVTRDIWNEKLYTLDNLVRGKLLSHRNGHSLLSGVGFGGIMLGIFILSIFISDKTVPVWFVHDDPEYFMQTGAWSNCIVKIIHC